MASGVAGHPPDHGQALKVMTSFVFHRHGDAAPRSRRLPADTMVANITMA
jgi:hypothetical protein